MRLLLATGFAAVAILGIGLAASTAWERLGGLRAELAGLTEQNRRIRSENDAFAREAALLRADPAALERVARREYGLVRADEQVLRIDLRGAPR